MQRITPHYPKGGSTIATICAHLDEQDRFNAAVVAGYLMRGIGKTVFLPF